MNRLTLILLCLAYLLGLLVSAFPYGGLAVLGLGFVVGLILPRYWRRGPRRQIWWIAGVVGCLASFYLLLRVPQPAPSDISRFATPTMSSQVTVHGRVEEAPRLTRSQRVQFWLQAKQLDEVIGEEGSAKANQDVTGHLYVTVPQLQGTGISPGQLVMVSGRLYQPQAATNPGAFDFQAYLARQGSFAGLSGQRVTVIDSQVHWGVWQIRHRLNRALVRFLKTPEGLVVSGMVLGKQAVDLPYGVRDSFAQAGLAHTLVASGFHVSLLLGFILWLTRPLPSRTQFVIGLLGLVLFVVITGLQPSVLRAALMGVGALMALCFQQRLNSLGSLLAAATILLLINPLWIWDLGFQLSFLATLALLVTAQPLTQSLDWLPPKIAALIAVPIAAYVWTLPLQLHAFGLVSTYSVPLNILASPLVIVISIGGMVSSIVALIWPIAGSALALLLKYPVQLLLLLVEGSLRLPGSTIAVGTISILQLVCLYGLFLLIWVRPWWQKHWWVVGAIVVGLVVIPVWYTQSMLVRVSVLATGNPPVVIVQDRGKVGIVNMGDPTTAQLTVLPFLQKEGVNVLDWAINLEQDRRINTPTSLEGWQSLLSRLPIRRFYQPPLAAGQASNPAVQTLNQAVEARKGKVEPLLPNQPLQLGSIALQALETPFPVWQIRFGDQSWLWLGNVEPEQQKLVIDTVSLEPSPVLWWQGEELLPELLDRVQPKVAIAMTRKLSPETIAQVKEKQIALFWTDRDGAIQWTPAKGFQPTLDAVEVTPNQL